MNFQEEARRRIAATARAINKRQADLREGVEALEAQKRAKWERENGIQPGEYIIDAWQFRDAGKAASAAGMPFGPQLTNEERFRWRLR